jgi:uncharacterized protein (UPF0212 family)
VRGGDPLIFAKRVDHGIIPKSLKITKIVPCYMSQFQKSVYDKITNTIDDALDRRSEAISNFVFPCLNSDRTELEACFGKEGISTLRNQLRTHQQSINSKLMKMLQTTNENLIYLDKDNKTFYGDFLNINNLQHFSTKFYSALKNVNKLIYGKRGARTAFIYSNLVKVGIDIFKNVLIQNGYLEYSEKVQVSENTRCYFCGFPYSQHNKKLSFKTKKRGIIDVPEHEYHPSTFLVIIGKSNEGEDEQLPEENQKAINQVFNNIDNSDGKFLKFILGSKVISEGISMKNVSEVHILDVYFNFGRVDQVVGRAIRWCSHYDIATKNNPYPEVHVYKYAIMMKDGTMSTEEELYKKAEQKHMLVKKVERIMKEEAIDCALNHAGNIFNEELKTYKNCGQEGEMACPALCDYMDCNYKCSNQKLNEEYYDVETNTYRKVPASEIDKSTFSKELAKSEVDFCKQKIKELYLFNYIYTLESIINHVESFYSEHRKDLFDKYYVYKALDELVPLTENDFNNYIDIFVDKYNRQGYLIYVNNFYIFQPFEQPKTTPLYYRKTYDKYIANNISLYKYLKYSGEISKFGLDDSVESDKIGYDFDSVIEYYAKREEFDIVGIIDKEPNKKKTKTFDELEDVFKIREKRTMKHDKKRGIGIQTLTGSVCNNSKTKLYLKKLTEKLGVKTDVGSRDTMCLDIKNQLLDMEKYGTDKRKDKLTYIIIPANHTLYPFPYNLEDRTQFIIDKINSKIHDKLTIKVSEHAEKTRTFYKIAIRDDKVLNDQQEFLNSINAKKDKNDWIIIVK